MLYSKEEYALVARAAPAEGEERGSLPVGEEAEVADADEATWEKVKQEAAEELDGQAHDSLPVAVGGVSPAKADVALGKSHQPAVGDADAMDGSTEVAQGMFRFTEGAVGVDDPVVTEEES